MRNVDLSLREMKSNVWGTDSGRRLRILFLAHRIPFPPDKGEKLRSFWQLRTLAERHDIDLFCFYDDPEDEKHIGQLRQYCRECYVEKLSYLGSRVRALAALLRGRPFSTGFFFSRNMERRIQSNLKSRSYDRIFVFSSSMAPYVEERRDAEKVLDLVDVDSDKWRQYATHCARPIRWLWQVEARRLAAYEKSLVQTFSTTLVCTQPEARLLRSLSPTGSIQVLENYIDVDSYDPATIVVPDELRSWQPYIVLSGSMDYLPNIDAAEYFYREVFPFIRQARPETRFVIAGRNPHPSVRALGADPAVKVTGSVPDIRPYLRGAAVAVAPLRIARGVQNKVLEALASGVPVITSSAVAAALPASLRASVKAADEPGTFAKLVLAALQTKNISIRLRNNFRAYVENLALSSQLENLMQNPTVDSLRQQPSEQTLEYTT
jgi:sugar transferase (PEP-CTERM/EpsH1 system associated)